MEGSVHPRKLAARYHEGFVGDDGVGGARAHELIQRPRLLHHHMQGGPA